MMDKDIATPFVNYMIKIKETPFDSHLNQETMSALQSNTIAPSLTKQIYIPNPQPPRNNQIQLFHLYKCLRQKAPTSEVGAGHNEGWRLQREILDPPLLDQHC